MNQSLGNGTGKGVEMTTVVDVETKTTTAACLACDGTGKLCGDCGNPTDKCSCKFHAGLYVADCGDCNGTGTKPVAESKEEYGGPVAGEMDLRDDEPLPAWKADKIAAIQQQERNTTLLERDYLAAKEHAKDCKDIYEAAIATLRRLIRELNAAEKPMPLLDSLDKPENEQPVNEKWRTVCIDALQAHGVSESIVGKLRDKAIETLGDLADFQGKHGEFWAKEIKGLGPAKAAKVTDAQAAFWQAHPEYCNG